MNEDVKLTGKFTVTKYENDEAYKENRYYEKNSFGNLALNEGITALLNLLTGGTEDAFNNANSYIGVGDDNTAAAAGQTGLQAITNKEYVAVAATYPQISGQTVTWQAEFGSANGNFNWREFTVANGNSDAADNLNRAVSDQGTKVNGQTWTIDLDITVS